MLVGIQNAAATSEKTKDPGLHKGNTGSQTLDLVLLPKRVDSYADTTCINNQLSHHHSAWAQVDSLPLCLVIKCVYAQGLVQILVKSWSMNTIVGP